MVILLNAALYQAGWVACTLGAAKGLPWVGPAAAAAIVAWHLVRARDFARESRLIALAGMAGLCFETLLLQSGLVAYPGGTAIAGLAPMWMVALWGLFATTFNVSLRRLRDHPVLAAALGGLGGPVAYYAGTRLGAIDLVAPAMALVAIGIAWAIATPLLMRAARRYDGYAA